VRNALKTGGKTPVPKVRATLAGRTACFSEKYAILHVEEGSNASVLLEKET
jgi:hypothetical protein